MPQLLKGLDAINCAMETLAIQAKYKTSALLFADLLQSKGSIQARQYNPQRDIALAQAQLSRLNR
jgi:hypothetical protein